MKKSRGKVWLAVSGLVITSDGKWLVVKKKYGGLKDQWSLPAGFVEPGETADEAVVREIKEETGISCSVTGMIGLRSGVIKEEISDNMILFMLGPLDEQTIRIQDYELFDVQFMDPKVLAQDVQSSVLLKYMLNIASFGTKPLISTLDPGKQFGYSSYRVFL